MSHTPAPATRARRSQGKVLKPLAVLAITAGLSCSAVSAATAAPILRTGHGASVEVVATEAPVINTDPSDVSTFAGDYVSFAASSSDPEAFQQWQVSEDAGLTFTDIAGANSTYLELYPASYSQNGFRYRALFTNADGTTETAAATLTLTASPPIVTEDPSSTQVASGAKFAFTASAEADPAPSIQWQVRKDGVVENIPGATAARYAGNAPTMAHSGWRFRAVFTNPDSSVNSAWAVLTVTASKPSVVTAPVNVTVDAGKVATFTSQAKADPAPRAQWQVRVHGTAYYEDIAGANRSSYSFKPTKAESANLYRVRYTNSAGEVTTRAATLTVHGTVPGKPRSVTAVQTGRGKVTVRWAAPTAAGSAPITSYDVGYSAGQWGNGKSVRASARSTVFSGLAAGRYTFSVSAVNAAGQSVRTSFKATVR